MTAQLLRAACLSLLLSSCSITGPSERDELQRNRERWEARQPTTYEFVLQRGACECLPEWLVPMQILVHQGRIQSAVNLQTGEPITAETRVLSIDGLFALIEQALEMGAHRVAVSYDRDLGYPASIFIDYDREYVDDEMIYTARALRAVE